MNFNGIPEEVLNMVVDEAYEPGEITLKWELEKYGQDILAHRYNIVTYGDGKPALEWFQAWTKDYALVLIANIFGGQTVLGALREIPLELKSDLEKRKKRHGVRKK